MKRKLFLTMIAISLIVCCVVLCACNKEGGSKTSNDNVCRQTNAYYAGESDTVFVSIEVGRREKNFIADGKATDVGDFVEITIVPLKKNDCQSVSYSISGQDSVLSGEIAMSNYGEFVSLINLDFVPTSVNVTLGDDVADIDLCNILEGALSPNDIVNIAKTHFQDRIAKESEDGKPQREIYIKLISGDRTNYYYYVSFIGEGVDYWALLIEPNTGAIVSKK